jgi:DNA topoisomerase-1
MEMIQATGETREKVLDDVVSILKPVLEQIKAKEKTIGEKLSNAMVKRRLEERIVGSCPACKTGKLTILHSKETGKQFIGCSNYFKGLCSTSFALPQKNLVSVTSKVCRHCGWPVVLVRAIGRHSWMLCFNPECTRRRRREAGLQNVP